MKFLTTLHNNACLSYMKNEEMLLSSCASSISLQKKRRWNLVKKIWSSWDFDYSTSEKEKKSSINAVVAQLALKSSAKKSIDLLEEVLCTIGILMDATIQNDFFYLWFMICKQFENFEIFPFDSNLSGST